METQIEREFATLYGKILLFCSIGYSLFETEFYIYQAKDAPTPFTDEQSPFP
jgi:hypothetical protein